jgi:hypothetical protein
MQLLIHLPAVVDQIDSDVDFTEVKVTIRCTTCKQVRETTIFRESFDDLTDNGDGTYTDLYGECAVCLGA